MIALLSKALAAISPPKQRRLISGATPGRIEAVTGQRGSQAPARFAAADIGCAAPAIAARRDVPLPVGRARTVAGGLARARPAAIAQAGHLIPHECPDACVGRVADFIGGRRGWPVTLRRGPSVPEVRGSLADSPYGLHMDGAWMIEILDVVDTGRRRRFSVSEKIRIVEESLAGPNNLARSTARRHGIALTGLYLWRRQYRRGELGWSQRPKKIG